MSSAAAIGPTGPMPQPSPPPKHGIIASFINVATDACVLSSTASTLMIYLSKGLAGFNESLVAVNGLSPVGFAFLRAAAEYNKRHPDKPLKFLSRIKAEDPFYAQAALQLFTVGIKAWYEGGPILQKYMQNIPLNGDDQDSLRLMSVVLLTAYSNIIFPTDRETRMQKVAAFAAWVKKHSHIPLVDLPIKAAGHIANVENFIISAILYEAVGQDPNVKDIFIGAATYALARSIPDETWKKFFSSFATGLRTVGAEKSFTKAANSFKRIVPALLKREPLSTPLQSKHFLPELELPALGVACFAEVALGRYHGTQSMAASYEISLFGLTMLSMLCMKMTHNKGVAEAGRAALSWLHKRFTPDYAL